MAILQEIGISPERLNFYYVPRLDAEAFVENVKGFFSKILRQKVEERRK